MIIISHIRLKLCFLFLIALVVYLQNVTLVVIASREENSVQFGQNTKRESSISGIMSICLYTEPDGTALIEDTSTREEILVVFKVDHFWLITTKQLNDFIKFDSKFISSLNQSQASPVWPKFPISPKLAVSFSGLDRESVFYNQVFVFKDSNLFRYQVKILDTYQGKLDVLLVSTHTTSHWSGFPNINDVLLISIPRKTRILVAQRKVDPTNFAFKVHRAYILNEANLDNPVEHEVYHFGLPGRSNDYKNLKFHHMLSNNQTIAFLTTGDLCIDKVCKSLHQAIVCDPQVIAFANSFAYWLWRNTDFSVRLIIVCLSSIMIVNLTMSIFFIINQIKRIVDLT